MSFPRRFKHWAYLNDEGMKDWGCVFPDGKVPVLSMIPSQAKLQGLPGTDEVYMVYLDELTLEQFEKIVDIWEKKSGEKKEIISREIKKIGLPLRVSQTRGAGTDHSGFFI